MNKILRSSLHLASVVSLGLLAGTAYAEPAVIITEPFDGTASGRGASVSGGGEWSIITDGPDQCDLRIYRRNWATMGWGEGTGLSDETPFDVVTNNSPPTCTDGNFGNSSSLSGDMLVLGVNSWDSTSNFCPPSVANAGGILVYTWNGLDLGAGGEWERRQSGNCVNSGEVIVAGDPQTLAPDDRQAGAEFGTSVSVNQIAPGEYLIAVGEPGFDNGGDVDVGRVSVYNYAVGGSTTTDTITRIGTAVGDSPNDRLGTAVTTNAPYVLAGAPGVNGADNDGYARVWDTTTGNLVLAETFTVPLQPGAELGREVSYSDEYLVVSGADVGFVWFNTAGDGSPDTLELQSLNPLSLGGDVSQAGGIVAFGLNSPLADGGAEIFRDVRNDVPDESILANVVDDVGGTLDDIGRDIRLVDESLWFANEARNAATPAERAILYQYPAGYGARLDTAFQYDIRSLPCDVSGLRVDQVFAYLNDDDDDGISDGPITVPSGGDLMDIYSYDSSNVTSARPYRQLADDYVFAQEDLRFPVWVAVATPQYLPVGDCAGFTEPDFVEGTADDIVNDGADTAFSTTIRAQKIIVLENAATPPGGVSPTDDFARLLVNNPFPRPIDANDIRYENGLGVIQTLAEAEADNNVSSTLYVYDPVNPDIPSGQNYRAVTATGTPGFSSEIGPQQGFWLPVLADGKAGGGNQGHALLMPQPD